MIEIILIVLLVAAVLGYVYWQLWRTSGEYFPQEIFWPEDKDWNGRAIYEPRMTVLTKPQA